MKDWCALSKFSAVTQVHPVTVFCKTGPVSLHRPHQIYIGVIDGGILWFAVLKRLWACASSFVPWSPSVRCSFFADLCHGSAMACKGSTVFSVKLWEFLSRITQKQYVCAFSFSFIRKEIYEDNLPCNSASPIYRTQGPLPPADGISYIKSTNIFTTCWKISIFFSKNAVYVTMLFFFIK